MKRVAIAFIALLAVLLTGCKKEPVASFEYSTDADDYTAPVEVKFDNRSTEADSYVWDFGDGITSTDENPVHKYEASDYGTLTVSLTAKGRGGEASTTKQIQILKPTTVIVRNESSFDLYDVEAHYWDGETFTFLWAYGDMAAGTAGTEIWTTAPSVDVIFDLSDGSSYVTYYSTTLVKNTVNYVDITDETEVLSLDSKSAGKSAAKGTALGPLAN